MADQSNKTNGGNATVNLLSSLLNSTSSDGSNSTAPSTTVLGEVLFSESAGSKAATHYVFGMVICIFFLRFFALIPMGKLYSEFREAPSPEPSGTGAPQSTATGAADSNAFNQSSGGLDQRQSMDEVQLDFNDSQPPQRDIGAGQPTSTVLEPRGNASAASSPPKLDPPPSSSNPPTIDASEDGDFV